MPASAFLRADTLETVRSWADGTLIEYCPEGKRPGTLSHARYQKYRKAKTVAQALKLGAKRSDLFWDYDRGLLRFVGGPTGRSAKAKEASAKTAREAARGGDKAAKAGDKAAKGDKKAAKAGKALKVVKRALKEAKAPMAAKEAEEVEEDEEAVKPAAAEDSAEEKAKKRSHTSYQPETFMEITRWMAETRIEYKPHAKREGSKSYVRYESYSQATTVAESLALGSKPEDWCWDFERDFIKVLGPVRDEPLDQSNIQDTSKLSDVDHTVGRWFKREAARMLGVDLKELTKDKSWGESVLIRIKRSVAEKRATEILDEVNAAGRPITEAHVLRVLDQWGFKQNSSRENVMPDDVNWVNSDTLGLIPSRDGRIIATRGTYDYPNVIRLLTRFLKDHKPVDMKMHFPFTSINVNKNYAAKLHRDRNNRGPSMIKALGSFTNGQLNYFPDDDQKLKLEELAELPATRMATLDLKKGFALFDGRRGHSVNAFEGDRYSLVYFTCARCEKADPELKVMLLDREVTFPTKESTAWCMRVLEPPAGYNPKEVKSAVKEEGKYRFWPIKDLQAAPARGTKRSQTQDDTGSSASKKRKASK